MHNHFSPLSWWRCGAWILGAAAAGWWLFADTVRHHWGDGREPGIRFVHFGTYAEYETWQEIIEAFEKVHPDIPVKHEYVVGWYGLYETKLRQQLAAGAAPDVVMLQDEPFPNLAGQFADLRPFLSASECEPALERDFDQTAVRSFLVEGALRAMPVAGGNLLIYLNLAALDRAAQHHHHPIDPPDDDWTIDEFRRLAEELTCDFDGDGRIDQFGFWRPWWVYYLPFMYAFGAEVLDESNSHWTLTGDAAVESLRFYQGLRSGKPVCPSPAEVGQMNQDMAFLTGKVALCVNGPWFQPFLRETSMADLYRILHVPRGCAGRGTRITWDGLAIPEQVPPERKRDAWTFIRFACSREAQDRLARTQRALPSLIASLAAYEQEDRGMGGRKFVEALSYSRLQPISPYWDEMDRTIKRHFGRLTDERGPRAEAADVLSQLSSDPVIVKRFGRERREP